MKIKSIVLSTVLLLSGCKVEMNTEVPLSKLFSDQITKTNAELLIEVAACNSYEDSRKPSDSLQRAKGAIADLFNDSEFKECFTQKFNSFARFEIPLAIGNAKALKPEDPKVRVLSYEKAAFVDVSPTLKEKLKSYRDNKLSIADFDPASMSVNINIVNDTASSQKVRVTGVYLDNYPVIDSVGYELKDKSKTLIRLSNVTTETIFLPAEHKMMAYFMAKME